MSGRDSKYFSTTKKGEIPELKEELNSQYKDKRKDAVKKVIAAMTVGKDVSSLFTDVLNCMQSENLELKKLVYLYLINYAKSQPDLAILAVNTFVKDSQDPNPLIRALAVRTMGCIRVDKITEYLCDPLQRCLKDDDPYVRKTAAICVAKLYDINAELVEDRGFLDTLKDLISDNNPMVVANAVAALAEIQEHSSRPIFEITSHTLSKLLTALNECTEWGQVFILDALSVYKAADAREAENIVERVTPRLQHANCAVVLSAVKLINKTLPKSVVVDKWKEISFLGNSNADKVISTWSPPFQGFRLNFDGSSRDNPGISDIGGIIRGCNGQFVLSFEGPIGVSDASEAEVEAMVEGINQAVNYGLFPLVVEGALTNAIQKFSS